MGARIICSMDTPYVVCLSPEERVRLQQLLRAGTARARLLTRARILLLADRSVGEHRSNEEVAHAAFCSASTARRTRRRFCAAGLQAALTEQPRPGAPPKLTGDLEAKLFMLACSEPPAGQARWSLRLLADRMVELGYVESISHVAVRDHLKRGSSSPGM